MLSSFVPDNEATFEMELSNVDRDQIVSFLSQGSGSGCTPQSGQITGILKPMKETMEGDLAEATTAENSSITNFDSLVAAKEKKQMMQQQCLLRTSSPVLAIWAWRLRL